MAAYRGFWIIEKSSNLVNNRIFTLQNKSHNPNGDNDDHADNDEYGDQDSFLLLIDIHIIYIMNKGVFVKVRRMGWSSW